MNDLFSQFTFQKYFSLICIVGMSMDEIDPYGSGFSAENTLLIDLAKTYDIEKN